MQIIQIKESLNIFKEYLIILSMPEVHNIQRAQCLIGLFKRKKKKKEAWIYLFNTTEILLQPLAKYVII